MPDAHTLVPCAVPSLVLPLYDCRVPAGFPSPSQDYDHTELDLHAHLVRRPAATFMVRAQGDSMVGAGIFDGDLLVVDRSLTARTGDVVVAVVSGELTLKRLDLGRDGSVRLMPANPAYQPISIPDPTQLEIWGVVMHSVHSFRRN